VSERDFWCLVFDVRAQLRGEGLFDTHVECSVVFDLNQMPQPAFMGRAE